MDFKTSVRALVEFVYRNGDYDRTRGTSEDAMAQGARIHKMIQARQGPAYRPEVPLSFIHRGHKYNILIDGRADGVIHIEGERTFKIDEIKGTYRSLKNIDGAETVHMAQARCYGFIYGHDIGCADEDKITICITYCNMDTEDIVHFDREESFLELRTWFEDTLAYYRRFTDISYRNLLKAGETIMSLGFPYPYRKGQRELMGHVYSTIRHEKKLFLQAPTGTGKTLATVFPALKALGQGHFERIFYLTARNTQSRMASDTLELLRDGGMELSSLVLSSRERICPMEKTDCTPLSCPRAKGHFDRINDVLYDLIKAGGAFNGDDIAKAADAGAVCPFELGLDLSLFTNFIICDYNYAFDPRARLARFFGDGARGSNLFLIDEAHNLLERGREMFSACISEAMINNLRRIFIKRDKRISAGTGKVKKQLELLRPEGGFRLVNISDSLINELSMLFDRMGSFFERVSKEKRIGQRLPGEGISEEEMDSALEVYFELSHFLDMYDNMKDDYCVYTKYTESEQTGLMLYCVDPGRSLREAMKNAVSAILFSATLLPIQYYKGLLGGLSQDYEVYAPSSFDPERLGIFIGRDVTSRYNKRGPDLYRRIAEYISGAVSVKPGNYMVFFPSYRFMEDVYEIYEQLFLKDDYRCVLQSPSMNDEQRREFIGLFCEGVPTVGFCIMGSIFSEGIDLVGDSLIGAVIVGTGTPMVCSERELLKGYFDKRYKRGFDYAYKYPGMNKVLQCAGRVIRTAQDKGIVLLLDDRFTETGYSTYFPREWKRIETVIINDFKDRMSGFWNGT